MRLTISTQPISISRSPLAASRPVVSVSITISRSIPTPMAYASTHQHAHDAAPLPLAGRGRGWGVIPSSDCGFTPPLAPPRQGGGNLVGVPVLRPILVVGGPWTTLQRFADSIDLGLGLRERPAGV